MCCLSSFEQNKKTNKTQEKLFSLLNSFCLLVVFPFSASCCNPGPIGQRAHPPKFGAAKKSFKK